MSEVDLAIVGAGAAGLAAAMRGEKLGLSCRVLEARHCTGGRCLTIPGPQGLPVDIGASWLHAADQGHPLAPLAADQGVDTEFDPRRRLAFKDGRPLNAGENAAFQGAREGLLDALDRPQPVGVSVADVAKGGAWDDAARVFLTRAVCGAEPGEVDAEDWRRSVHGEDLLTAQGYGALLARVSAGVRVTTQCPVEKIEVARDGVRVASRSGTLRAKSLILTVPVSVLAQGGIAFDPPLPRETRRDLEALPLGLLMKVVLGLSDDAPGPRETSYVHDTSDNPHASPFTLYRPMGANIAYAFFGGDPARELERQQPGAATDAAIETLAACLGSEFRKHARPGPVSRWGRNPWARGTYTVAVPGGHGARQRLRAPLFERLWLAGEATAPDGWHATVAGAWLAGERAVEEAAVSLRER